MVNMNEKIQNIKNEIGKVIKGKEEVIDTVLAAMLAEGHILLEDVPGVGKTTLALTLSRVLGLGYRRIQFTPDTVPSDITGFTMYDKESGSFRYEKGAAFCNLLLANPVGASGSHGGKAGHGGRKNSQPAAPILCHRNAKPRRRCRHAETSPCTA